MPRILLWLRRPRKVILAALIAMVGLIVVGALALDVVFSAAFGYYDHHATDAELIRAFTQHRATYDSLAVAAAADPTPIDFVVWSRGMLSHGDSKGYTYSPTPLTPLAANLDDKWALRKTRHGEVYRPIAPSWYLFYEW